MARHRQLLFCVLFIAVLVSPLALLLGFAFGVIALPSSSGLALAAVVCPAAYILILHECVERMSGHDGHDAAG